MNASNKVTKISEIGEFGLIDKLKNKISHNNNLTLKGIGDDCAVIKCQEKKETLISSDLLVEGVHFDLTYMSLAHIGYKAVIVNLSDVYSMNANPSQIIISLAVSNKYSVEDLEDLYEGVNLAAKNYKVNVVGGDVSASFSGLIISIAVLGFQKKEKIVYRNGAKKNDLIVVSGDLGASYLGLQILQREKTILDEHKLPKLALKDIEDKLKDYKYLIQRQVKPEINLSAINFLKINNIKPNSMIDVSDGLFADLNHICNESKLGFTIFEKDLPIHQQTKNASLDFNIDHVLAALHGGEDYELLFTISQKNKDVILKEKNLKIIGEIIQDKNQRNMIQKSGKEIPLSKLGWDHFGKNN